MGNRHGDRGAAWRVRRLGGRVVALGAAIIAGGAASLMIASAHHVVSSTAECEQGTSGWSACGSQVWPAKSTQLRDDAYVYADSTREVDFALWNADTCSLSPSAAASTRQGALFVSIQNVGTPTIAYSHVLSQGFMPSVSGVYEWTVQILAPSGVDGWTVESSSGCGQQGDSATLGNGDTPTPTPSEAPSETPSSTPSESPSSTPSPSASPSPSATAPGGTPSPSPSGAGGGTPSGGVSGLSTPSTGSGVNPAAGLLMAAGPVLMLAGIACRGYLRRRNS